MYFLMKSSIDITNRYNKLKELIKILLELGYHTLAIKKQLFLRFMIGVKGKHLK